MYTHIDTHSALLDIYVHTHIYTHLRTHTNTHTHTHLHTCTRAFEVFNQTVNVSIKFACFVIGLLVVSIRFHFVYELIGF